MSVCRWYSWCTCAQTQYKIIFSQEAETAQAQKQHGADIFKSDIPLWKNLSKYKRFKQPAARKALLLPLRTPYTAKVLRTNSCHCTKKTTATRLYHILPKKRQRRSAKWEVSILTVSWTWKKESESEMLGPERHRSMHCLEPRKNIWRDGNASTHHRWWRSTPLTLGEEFHTFPRSTLTKNEQRDLC